MDRGIQLLAIGAREYGQWARNMAVSIRHHNPDVHITLVHDGKATASMDFAEQYGSRKLYDMAKVMRPEHYTRNNRLAPGFAKTHLPLYTPYKTTLYADVDGLCVSNLDTLFAEADNKPFIAHTWGNGRATDGDKDWGHNMMWSTPSAVWSHFELAPQAVYPFTNSSLMLYTEKGASVLHIARELMLDKEMPVRMHRIRWGKGNQPDELYVNAACAILGIDPDTGTKPIYFRPRKAHGGPTVPDDLKGYYFLGAWGDVNMNHDSIYRVYDRLLSHYCMAGGCAMGNKAHQLMKRKFVKTH